MSTSESSASAKLSADYKSPTGQHTFSYEVPAVSGNQSTEETTDFLAKLRQSAVQMQQDINTFLTQKMDEDKAMESTKDVQHTAKVDEDKEEDNYGEEVDEE
jgi:phosphoribosylanthranilate isomerase